MNPFTLSLAPPLISRSGAPTKPVSPFDFGLEAAFATGPVVTEGAQITFGRLRYRVDVPVAGTYTVTTPYGIFTKM